MKPIDEATIRQAVDRLLATAPTGSRVIVFGSRVRGDAQADSDVDILVVEPAVQDRLVEMARLEMLLAPLRIPVDLLVVSAERFEYWRDTPNTIIHKAAKEGRVYGQIA